MSKNLKTDGTNDINMSELCSLMYLAVVQKYMYDCYQIQKIQILTPKDWLGWQLIRGKLEMLSDVVEGITPAEFKERIKHDFQLISEGETEGYEEQKEPLKGMIVTYDHVYIARLRLWDWLINRNFIARYLGLHSFIEINLISDVDFAVKKVNILKLNIKIQTKAMSKKGEGEIAELRFNVKKGEVEVGSGDDITLNNVIFEEILFMHKPLDIFTEKKMEHSNKLDIIEFMQKFIEYSHKERERMTAYNRSH